MPSISEPPVDIDIDWRAIGRLLEAGQYDQIAQMLERSEWPSSSNEHALLTSAVGAIRQISFACRQYQVDSEWHQQATLEAQRRERSLRENARAILHWMALQWPFEQDHASPTLARPARGTADIHWPHTLMQRLSNWLHLLKKSFTSAPVDPLQQPKRAGIEPPPSAAELKLAPAPVETDIPPPALAAALPAEGATPTPVTDLPARKAQPPRALDTIMVYCFGPFHVYQHNQHLEHWNGYKGQAIFKYLLAQRGTPVPKDVLMDLFWPEGAPEAARRNLHQAIYSLRQTLRQLDSSVQYILFEHNQYSLNPALRIWIDVEEFEAQVRRGQQLELANQEAEAMHTYAAAVSLYQGDYLADDLYEDWPQARRQRLRLSFLEIADQLSGYYYRQAEYSAAIALCQQILSYESCFESVHQRLMQIYLAAGQRHLAIRQYQRCVETLAAELDIPPSAETRALYESITAHS